MLLLTGCATKPPIIHEISSDKYIISLTNGVPFTPPCEGKFVPQARFNELLDVYLRAASPPSP